VCYDPHSPGSFVGTSRLKQQDLMLMGVFGPPPHWRGRLMNVKTVLESPHLMLIAPLMRMIARRCPSRWCAHSR
jgi:hypothetical protein